MNDVKVLAAALQAIEERKGAERIMLQAMLCYFSSVAPKRMIPSQKVVIRELTPFLSSDDVLIRKQVILILAEFKKKIPKEFGRSFKRMTPAQQRLIDLHS